MYQRKINLRYSDVTETINSLLKIAKKLIFISLFPHFLYLFLTFSYKEKIFFHF
jgi:hypothetical protein